jgi:hypothetical protein
VSQNLENVIRPFETGEVSPPSVVPTAQVVPVKNVIINPGRHGSTKTMSGSFSLTVTFYMKKKSKEETQAQASRNP